MPMDILTEPMGYLGPRRGAALIPLILKLGDSGIVGEGTTDTADPAFNVTTTQSTAFVWFDKHFALATNDPLSYQPDVTGGVRPWATGGTPGMDIAVSLGQTLTAQGIRAVIGSFGIFGLSVAQMLSSSNFPTLPPAGPNVYSQMVTRAHALEVARGARTRIAFISADGNDGANSTDANAVQAHNAAFAAQLRSDFPGITIIWLRIHSDTINVAGFPSIGTAMSQQAAFFVADPTIKVLDTDDVANALLSDHAHEKSDTQLIVGNRLAWMSIDALGIARPQPATFPMVAGYGPQTFGHLASTPTSFGGERAGDLEILGVLQLTAAGTNNALVTPSGWTLIGTLSSTSGGSTARAGFYRRVVDSAMLAANHGFSAPTTVSAANAINFAQIFTIRGVNPAVPPTVEASQLSKNDAFGTSLSMTGVTTLGANRTVVMITLGYRTNANANAVTISAPSLTGITVIKNGTRANDSTSDFGTFDVQIGTLAAAGPTGNPAATLALNTIAVGGVFAITP